MTAEIDRHVKRLREACVLCDPGGVEVPEHIWCLIGRYVGTTIMFTQVSCVDRLKYLEHVMAKIDGEIERFQVGEILHSVVLSRVNAYIDAQARATQSMTEVLSNYDLTELGGDVDE